MQTDSSILAIHEGVSDIARRVISTGYMTDRGTKNILLRLDPSLRDEWEKSAAGLMMSRSDVARALLKWFVKQPRRKQLEVLGVWQDDEPAAPKGKEDPLRMARINSATGKRATEKERPSGP
jgi:hypothetical protein